VDDRFIVVFVCTGNRARSPLAEAFLSALVDPLAVSVSSRGTLNLGQVPALPEAVIAGSARGVDLSGHRASTFGHGELARSDLVIGFEPFHLSAAVIDGGASRHCTFSILELGEIFERFDAGPRAAGGYDPADVVRKANGMRRGSLLSAPTLADPLGLPQQQFDATADAIKALVETIAERLFAPSP
jgi:protein-tyrosine phosphatase